MSATEILSKVTLSFNDKDLYRVYIREKTDFFRKTLIIVCIMILALCIGMEAGYSQVEGGLPKEISILNWICFSILVVIALFHHKCTLLHVLVCPILTILTILYISFVDYDKTMQSIYYS